MTPTEIPIAEAQKRLAPLSYHQVYRLCRDGVLAHRKDAAGRLFVDTASLEAFIAARAVTKPDADIITEEVARAARGEFVKAIAVARLEQLAEDYDARCDTENAQRCRDAVDEIRAIRATVDRARRVMVVESPTEGRQEAPIVTPSLPVSPQLADVRVPLGRFVS